MRLPKTGGAHVVRLDAGVDGHVPTQDVGVNTHTVSGVRVITDQNDGIATGRGHSAHTVPRLPQATPRRIRVEQAELTDRGNSQRHIIERNHSAAAKLVHTSTAIRVDDNIDARAATGQRIVRILVAGRRCDAHSPEGIHGFGQGLAAHAAQLPGDHARLPITLSTRSQVSELAAANATRTRLGPDGLDAIR